MNKGTVKWFNNQKGFGFICDEQGNDIYPMNNKKFTVTVNVYANATVVSAGQ